MSDDTNFSGFHFHIVARLIIEYNRSFSRLALIRCSGDDPGEVDITKRGASSLKPALSTLQQSWTAFLALQDGESKVLESYPRGSKPEAITFKSTIKRTAREAVSHICQNPPGIRLAYSPMTAVTTVLAAKTRGEKKRAAERVADTRKSKKTSKKHATKNRPK